MYSAYAGEQHDLRWVTVTLTAIAIILLTFRISITIKNRGWLGVEDALVIASTVGPHLRISPTDADTEQVWLIIFAVCVYMATIYGFGMRVVDIKRTGGDIKEALKVSRAEFLCCQWHTDTLAAVLLAYASLLHLDEWLQ